MKRGLMIPLLAIAVTVSANAAVGKKGNIADVSIGYGSVTWQPLAAYPGLCLSVAKPDGVVLQQTFSAGVTPSFSLSGGHFPDGQYTWELRVVVADAAIARRDEAAVAEGADAPPAPVQSGFFTVSQGALVVPGTTEERAVKDIVHLDDVIADGNLAVGNDAYSGYVFGYDTIALMEENLRIFFNDTTTLANFPNNDWRLVANDRTEGGGEYFAIEDATAGAMVFLVEAGAPANSLYVDINGDVGINTATVDAELHILDGNTATVRLEQDASYGWPAQIWDVGAHETYFFINDSTHGNKKPLRIESNTPTATLALTEDGYVGIGTGDPGWPLTVETDGEAATLVLNRTDGAMGYINAGHTYVNIGTGTPNHLRFTVNGAWKTQINTDGSLHMASGATCTSGGVWTDSSSRELKSNIEILNAEKAMATLAGLEPVTYTYKADEGDGHVGFIAEDVPDLVASKDRKGMSPMDVTAVLTKVVQEQQKVITDLRCRLEALEKEAER
jgi:Chaperone of endosialidase